VSAAAVATGAVGIFFTQVRIGYVAMFVGFLLGWLLLPNNRSKMKRRTRAIAVAALVLASAAALPVLATASNDPALASLATLSDDQRAAARPLNWQRSIEALVDSPVYGWGAGAAADTFDQFFPTGGRHVEPHNAFLKYFVEGGFVGGAMVVALALALVRRMDWGDVDALAAVIVLALFGVTSTIVDALPVSALLFLVIGLSRKKAPEGAAVPA
jgi:O-antigen ligase